MIGGGDDLVASALFSTDLTMSTNVNLALGTVTCTAVSISGSLTSADMNTTGSYRISGTPLAQALSILWYLNSSVSTGGTQVTPPSSSWTSVPAFTQLPGTLTASMMMNSSGAITVPYNGVYTISLNVRGTSPYASLGFWMSSSNSAVNGIRFAYVEENAVVQGNAPFPGGNGVYTGVILASDTMSPNFEYSASGSASPSVVTALSLTLIQRF